ncbi:hypothetical protein PHMEG_00034292, partial [Phytophthora megakarya]
RHGNNDMLLEISEKQQVPFDMKATEKVVWAALRDVGVRKLQSIKDFNAQVQVHGEQRRETNNTMTIRYVLLFKTMFTFRCRKAVRKYVEQDRLVFICVITTEPTSDTSHTYTLQFVVCSMEAMCLSSRVIAVCPAIFHRNVTPCYPRILKCT